VDNFPCFPVVFGAQPGRSSGKWKSLENNKNFILKKVISARYNKEKEVSSTGGKRA
jgi:hypothetical protein